MSPASNLLKSMVYQASRSVSQVTGYMIDEYSITSVYVLMTD